VRFLQVQSSCKLLLCDLIRAYADGERTVTSAIDAWPLCGQQLPFLLNMATNVRKTIRMSLPRDQFRTQSFIPWYELPKVRYSWLRCRIESNIGDATPYLV